MINQVKYCMLSKGEVYTELWKAAESCAYTSYLRGTRCNNQEQFFREISASFQFPYYFGENWPALDECLCDLEWISVGNHIKRVFIVVDDFHHLFFDEDEIQEDLRHRVIRYFTNMANYWHEQNVSVEILLNN